MAAFLDRQWWQGRLTILRHPVASVAYDECKESNGLHSTRVYFFFFGLCAFHNPLFGVVHRSIMSWHGFNDWLHHKYILEIGDWRLVYIIIIVPSFYFILPFFFSHE
ncbi:hypothetical protein V1514DRAFT_326272 [Lipomyces japonicus]|uniref:uncharacterized protein n=1 Tax=Lipomyces japonicus TaxID=56871 RepID=UPI0034CEC251